jgi:antitoxin HigA-1
MQSSIDLQTNSLHCMAVPEFQDMRKSKALLNPHPGRILRQEFLIPMQLSAGRLAHAIGVPPRRINEIVLGKRAITADTDLRLAHYFKMSDGFFLGLQTDYELMQRRRGRAAPVRRDT